MIMRQYRRQRRISATLLRVPRPPLTFDRAPALAFDATTMGTGSEAEGGGLLSGGLVLMQRFGVTVDDPGFDYLVHLTVTACEGRLVPELVSVRTRPGVPSVNSTTLRRVKLDAYMALVRQHLIAGQGRFLVMHKRECTGSTTYSPVAPDAWHGFDDEPKQRRAPSDVLPAVAAVYREALRSADPLVASKPTAYVASRLDYSRGHAARLVSQARRAGLLGNAYPGRAGEKDTEEER